MKRVTASDARRNWFRLLDEAAAGEVVVIERSGTRILLQREPEATPDADVPDYSGILSAPHGLDAADRWTWEWNAQDDLTLAEAEGEQE